MIIAGGGTGGHLFPGVAVAEAFLKRDRGNDALFVITGKPVEERVLGIYGFDRRVINVEGITGRGVKKAIAAGMKIPVAMWQSLHILRAYRPHVVLGVGGYVAGPVVLTASGMGYPTAIAEQNAIPGLTNKILGYVVDRVFLSLPDRAGIFPARKVQVTGNPIRSSMVAEATRLQQDRDERILTLLIFGGSQGARVINRTMVEALDYLEVEKDTLFFIHQSGETDYAQVQAAYHDKGFKADVRPFIVNMAEAYAKADLLICRAGATTTAEIATIGKAAVFIPFAQAVNDHQRENARLLVEAGAAEMILERDLSPGRLAHTILHYHRDRQALSRMAERAKALGNPRAADDIVDALYALWEERRGDLRASHGA